MNRFSNAALVSEGNKGRGFHSGRRSPLYFQETWIGQVQNASYRGKDKQACPRGQGGEGGRERATLLADAVVKSVNQRSGMEEAAPRPTSVAYDLSKNKTGH